MEEKKTIIEERDINESFPSCDKYPDCVCTTCISATVHRSKRACISLPEESTPKYVKELIRLKRKDQ